MSTGGTRHTVLYDYEATNPDELTIRAGDVVFVTEQLDKGWVRGYMDDQIGMFPAQYVEVDSSAPNPSKTTGSTSSRASTTIEGGAASAETAQVIEEFQTKDPAQLPLTKDQLVIIFRKFPTGWASGESMGKSGMFPLKNVRILDIHEAASLRAISASPTLSTASTSKKATNKEKRMSRIRSSTLSSVTREEEEEEDNTPGTPATVLFAYTAADKGQLSLISGETITVLDKLSGGWWKGRNEEGEVGFFPGSYVRENLSGATSPPAVPRDSAVNGSASMASLSSASMTSGGASSKRASTISKPSLKKATALFKYVAKSGSELSFEAGDEVLVFPVKDGESAGWWTGALASAPTVVAHFPASYVKMVGGGSGAGAGMGSDDSSANLRPSKDETKASKRKSQPASRGSGTLGRTTKPPSSKPPPRPPNGSDFAEEARETASSPRMDTSTDSGIASPRVNGSHTLMVGSGGVGGGGSSSVHSNSTASIGDLDVGQLTKNTEQALKVADQSKQGLIKLQQQSKTVFDGMLQRLDAADKDRQRLEHALREMHKLIQAGEAHRTKLAQQNQVLYQQVTDLKTQLSKESSARSNLEARLSRLEQGR